MKVNIITKNDFLDLAYKNTESFYEKINLPEVFVVKGFYDKDKVLELRQKAFEWGFNSAPSWHPCVDGCPDYHRIHDNYPKAYVKAIMHAYYRHGYYDHNDDIFNFFSEIFDLKNFLAGFKSGTFIKNIPSQFQIARVNMHNYPRGGGYQAEHIDPVSKFATIQTIVQASEYGKDFKIGGVYARKEKDGEKFYLDSYTEVGDLMVLSPGIYHGVDPIDLDLPLNWNSNDGRWMIMPIIINSDYDFPENIKPKKV